MSDSGAGPRKSDLSLGLYLILGLVASLGPISIDTYLPALPEIASSLDASDGMTQMSVTAFLFGLVVGPVVFGPISDAMGRRRLVLGSLVVLAGKPVDRDGRLDRDADRPAARPGGLRRDGDRARPEHVPRSSFG